MAYRTDTETRPGFSLAKGPIGLMGLASIAYGVLALIFGGASFALHIPHGYVGNGHFLHLLTNGWTDLLFIAGGLLLFIATPAHWLAKSAAFIVAVAYGGAAVIAVIRGNGVFGIFAANHLTEIVWGAAAIVLAILSLLPRVGARRRVTTVSQSTAAAPVARTRVPVADTADPRLTTDPRLAPADPTDPASTPRTR